MSIENIGIGYSDELVYEAYRLNEDWLCELRKCGLVHFDTANLNYMKITIPTSVLLNENTVDGYSVLSKYAKQHHKEFKYLIVFKPDDDDGVYVVLTNLPKLVIVILTHPCFKGKLKQTLKLYQLNLPIWAGASFREPDLSKFAKFKLGFYWKVKIKYYLKFGYNSVYGVSKNV